MAPITTGLPPREVSIIVAGAGDGKKDRWIKIGALFLNKNGTESVLLDALSVNGKPQLCTHKPTEDAGAPQV